MNQALYAHMNNKRKMKKKKKPSTKKGGGVVQVVSCLANVRPSSNSSTTR
jgi:hypothetical protein